jgi:hypothetical protein
MLPAALVAQVRIGAEGQPFFTHGIDAQALELVAQFGTLQLDDHARQARVLARIELARKHPQVVVLHGHHPALDAHQPVQVLGVVDHPLAIDGLAGHQIRQRIQAGLRDGIGQRVVLQNDIGDHPAIAAASDDLIFGHPHIGEEHLVEIALHGHVDQGGSRCRVSIGTAGS